MGIWDYVSSVRPDLSNIWSYVSSATERVKPHVSSAAERVKPDLTAGYKIGNALRGVAVEKLNRYWPDDQTRSEAALFAAAFAKNTGAYAVEEGVKAVPGGVPLYRIISKSIKNGGNKNSNDKKLDDKDEKIKELNARIEKLEKHGCGSCRKPNSGL